jgi:hypothetical protein
MLKSLVSSLSTSLRIGISKNGMTLLRVSGWRQHQVELLADIVLLTEESKSPRHIASQLEKLIKKTNCEGLPTAVIIDDEWARFFMVTPPNNCSRIEDCRAATNMRFQSLYGEAITDWFIEADWDPQHPFLACALPQSLQSELLLVAANCRLTITSIIPHFIATWNHWHQNLPTTSWFGVVNEGQLTLGIVDQDRLCNVRTATLTDNIWDDPEWLPDYINREALRLNVPAINSLQLCGDIPGQWTTCTIGKLQCVRLDGDNHISSQAGKSASLILANIGLNR